MIPLVVIGHLSVPQEHRARWLASPLATASLEWPEGPPLMQGDSPGAFATVGDVLAAAAGQDGAPNYFDYTDGELHGFLLPDAVMNFHQDLACALRQAALHGGSGRVAFVAFTEQAAFAARIGDDAEADEDVPAVTWMGAQQLFADEAMARRFMAEMEFVGAWDQDTSLTRAAFMATQAGLGLAPIESQPHHRALLDALLGHDVKAVHAKMRDAGVTGRHDRRLAEVFVDPAALAAALGQADPAARAAAIELLALVDPIDANARIEALLVDPSEHVLRHALRALGHLPDDAAFGRLLAFDDPRRRGFVQLGHSQAVEHSRAPGAGGLLAEALDGPLFAAKTWSSLDRAADPEAFERTVARAIGVLEFVALRKQVEAEPRLLAIFDQHPNPQVRLAAAGALARMQGPLAHANAAALQMALMGMGKALNQDDARRGEILGVDTTDVSLGIKRFDDLDGERLGTLVDEGFANPSSTQNASPAIGDFLAMANEFPELRFGGYTVPISRPDYRVSIDSVYVGLEDVDADRRAAIEALFEQLSQTATNTDPEGASLRCWWT